MEINPSEVAKKLKKILMLDLMLKKELIYIKFLIDDQLLPFKTKESGMLKKN